MDQDSKNISAAAYITPVGWLIAFAARHICDCATPFALHHLRQGLGFNLLIVVLRFAFDGLDIYVLSQLFSLACVVGVVYFAIGAYNEKAREVRYFSALCDKWLRFVK